MKHPFWIANSLLFFLLIIMTLFIYMMREPLPEREDIEPARDIARKKEEVLAINIQKIYENDLFGTYQKEIIKQSEIALPKIPEPPKPQVITPPKMPEPQFVDPLNITLKGIVVISAQEEKNRAIIEDNQTKKERTYKVGDLVEDAQLIRIFSNKIILLRSNGQQEVLYLREQDAKLDAMYATINSWEQVVQETDEDQYTINLHEFLLRVKNLAQFIDLLGLTTAYKDGRSIGCRVGDLEDTSLGSYLGLKAGDIIITVNTIPTATTEDRLKIYKEVMAAQDNMPIIVKLLRHNEEYELIYTLQSNKQEKKEQEKVSAFLKEQEEKKRRTLEQKYKFAPTLQEMRMHEKQRMQTYGRAPRANMPQSELGAEKK